MKGKYFLSEILTDDSRFKPHCINMITGNVGCGKSEFALNVLPRYAQSNYCILYLTDTNMNKDQIITHKDNTTEYDKEWRKFINSHTKVQIINRGIRNENMVGWGTFETAHVAITTMTYAKVGAILHYGHPFDWSKFDFIICDELDNLISFRNIKPPKGEPNILQFTVDKIRDTLRYPDIRIIGMTATPYKVYQEFKGNTYDILTTQEVADLVKYEINHIWHYKDYGKVLQAIPQGAKGIVYFDRINTMEIAEDLLIEKGHKTASFWSLKNKDHTMTQKQKDVRKYIIDNQMIPPDVDILLFNATCKTGINIRNKDITFMVIHAPMLHLKDYDLPSDTLQQVRGRVRKDLNTVYYHERDDIDYPSPVPTKYLNRKLTTDETEELCGEIRYMKPDKCNEYYKWNKVREYLEQHGYEATKTTIGHGGKTRGWIIRKL